MKSKTLAVMAPAVAVLATAPLAQAQDITTVATDLNGRVSTVAVDVVAIIIAATLLFILIWGVRRLKKSVRDSSYL